ncbi:MAG TPA: hypothetical protein VIW01_12395 [Dehalococcoidia bacterium]
MGRRSKTSALGSAKSWVEWKAELFEAIEQIDYACSEARQIIYKMRPWFGRELHRDHLADHSRGGAMKKEVEGHRRLTENSHPNADVL